MVEIQETEMESAIILSQLNVNIDMFWNKLLWNDVYCAKCCTNKCELN